jgi:hypothetical protein
MHWAVLFTGKGHIGDTGKVTRPQSNFLTVEFISFIGPHNALGCTADIRPTVTIYCFLQGDTNKLSIPQEDELIFLGDQLGHLFDQLDVVFFGKWT